MSRNELNVMFVFADYEGSGLLPLEVRGYWTSGGMNTKTGLSFKNWYIIVGENMRSAQENPGGGEPL